MRAVRSAASVAVILLAAVAALVGAGCGGSAVGSENPVTKQYDFKDFTQVEVESAFQVQITRGDTFKVEVTVDDRLVDRLSVEQNGATVKIAMTGGIDFGRSTRKAVVVVPSLEGVGLSGASRGEVSGFESEKNFEATVSGASTLVLAGFAVADASFDLSGASKATGRMTTRNMSLRATGASQVQLEGSGEDARLEAAGASKLKLDQFVVATADVALSGASTASVNVSRRMDVDLTGASRLTYTGDAVIGRLSTSGASQIKHQ
jgi:hypothetical protein